MSSTNQRHVQVFIPFIEDGITANFIRRVFLDKLLGNIMSIDLHDKKITNQGAFKSAKHSYAFIRLIPLNTSIGNNLRRNLEYNHTTHVMYERNGSIGSWEVKPHLSISDRLERGFNIIPSSSIPGYKSESKPAVHTLPVKPILPTESQVAVEEADLAIDIPEWVDYPLDTPFEFRGLPNKEPAIEYPFQRLCSELMRKQSLFDSIVERAEIQRDYHDIENAIRTETASFREYSLWGN
jgi:hypothetical protein